MFNEKRQKAIFLIACSILFILGVRTLFHGFPDIERFFAEWSDERVMLMTIIKFGTLNFAPDQVVIPPLYHYLTFIPIAIFFIFGKLIGTFHDKIEFVRFFFNNTHYFFFIGRLMSYLFHWLTAVMLFKTCRLFYSRAVSCITAFSYLLIPMFILWFSTTRSETLLFLNTSISFYFFLRFYLDSSRKIYLYLSAFFIGVATATKYNAIFLGSLFIPLLAVELKERMRCDKAYMGFITLGLRLCLFILLGFFICDPFFFIKFKVYLHNFLIFSKGHITYYGVRYYAGVPSVLFCWSHFKELNSLLYINPFGVLLLLIGMWRVFKRDRLLFVYISFAVLVYELYFGIAQTTFSPLRYLHPLLPLAVLIFAAGVDFIIGKAIKLAPILILFMGIAAYNYLDVSNGVSAHPTYIQEARSFIEKKIPEFTRIGIASHRLLPQLNMTRESYWHLLNTAKERHRYKKMEGEEDYDNIFRELRIESLTKHPQYNLIRLDAGVKTEEEMAKFLEHNRIEYIISEEPCLIDDKKIEDVNIAELLEVFEPKNRRALGGTTPWTANVYVYKVKGGIS